MRQMLHDALADARTFVGEVVGDLRGEGKLSDDELLARYEVQRGDPVALVNFVESTTGLQGGAALDEALRYESQMEELLADVQNTGGV